MRVRARIVCDSIRLGERLHEIALEHGLDVTPPMRTNNPDAFVGLGEVSLLILEQSNATIDQVGVRVYSLASAHPDLLVAVVVPPPRAAVDRELLRSAAFDVLEDSAELRPNFAHSVAAARRVVALQEERSRLHAELAHQDKLSALGVLAAGVSHEINNPCAAILSNITVLRDQLESIVARPRFQRMEALDAVALDWIEAFGDCVNAANRINTIVRTLNVFSRKSDAAQPAPTDVNEEVHTVTRLIGKEVRFQAELELELAPESPRVMAPPNTLTQIVTNLVVNALQALEGAAVLRPRVSITTECDSEHVLLRVEDNGPGVAPDVAPRIFDPFFTTKPIGKGTGLGLSIAKELVNKLGGEIFVEGSEGHGARFSVILDRSLQATDSVRTLRSLPPDSNRLRVLLLDDDDLILRSLQRSLASHFECRTIGDPRAALDLLDNDGDFDAVVSDVVMPAMNGLDFWRELGTTHPDLALRTVFISGGITSETLRVRVSNTGRPCLNKPVDMNELIRTIRRVGRPFEDVHR